ncbi:MAG: hypothetical protein LBU82_06390 [Treponema sp.]|jgi:hypothetical protein|nr:hypothetical protein [Treponema sp.]
MNMIFDYATNAFCPQRPAWVITPVNYQWAQSVFQDSNPRRICDAKKELKLYEYVIVFGRMIASLFRRRQIAQMEGLLNLYNADKVIIRSNRNDMQKRLF